MPAFLENALSGLDFSSRLMLGLIVGSGLACLLIIALGALKRLRHPQGADALPVQQASFPTQPDQILAVSYAFIMLYFAATALSHPGSRASSMTLSAAFFTLAWQLGLYLPLLVRYGLLPAWERPRPAAWQYLAWPLLTLAAVYLVNFGIELAGFYEWLINATQCPVQQAVVTQFQQGQDHLLRATLTVSAVIIAPVTEECCFRGFLYSTLRHWGGRVAATLASAAVFAAVHSSLAQFVPLFLFGIVLCMAYEKARSLWLPIAVHGLFNATTLISLLAAA